MESTPEEKLAELEVVRRIMENLIDRAIQDVYNSCKHSVGITDDYGDGYCRHCGMPMKYLRYNFKKEQALKESEEK